MSAPPLGVLLIQGLDEDALDLLAARLDGRISCPHEHEHDGWLGTREAAGYLSLSVHALHKLTAARAIPFEQDGPGCKLWFRLAELDRWRQGGSPRAVLNASTVLPQGRKAAS